MFEVKLKTGETFEATAVQESYAASAEETKCYCMILEGATNDRSLDWYIERLEAEGATERISISRDGTPIMTAEGYTVLSDVSLRLLVTGGRQLNIVLQKPSNI